MNSNTSPTKLTSNPSYCIKMYEMLTSKPLMQLYTSDEKQKLMEINKCAVSYQHVKFFGSH